jgi:hypothetical protein
MSHWKEVLCAIRLCGLAVAVLGSGSLLRADPLDPLTVMGNVQVKPVQEGNGAELVWTIQNTTNVILTVDDGLRTRGLAFNYTGGDRDDAPAVSSITGCDNSVMLAANTGACVLVVAFTTPAVKDTTDDENNDRGFWDLITQRAIEAPFLTASGPGVGNVQSGALVGRVEVDDPGVSAVTPEPASFVLVLTATLMGCAAAYITRTKQAV